MATLKERMGDIGKKGRIYVQRPRLEMDVEILDYKESYGQGRWLVKPLAGSGEAWVESVEIIETDV